MGYKEEIYLVPTRNSCKKLSFLLVRQFRGSIVAPTPRPGRQQIEKIYGKKNIPNLKFDIRFHLDPDTKTMKTQDNKSILIELEDEGWKFTCDNYEINIDNGLYFGNKNTYIENQNIFVSGILSSNEENIKWEIKKI